MDDFGHSRCIRQVKTAGIALYEYVYLIYYCIHVRTVGILIKCQQFRGHPAIILTSHFVLLLAQAAGVGRLQFGQKTCAGRSHLPWPPALSRT